VHRLADPPGSKVGPVETQNGGVGGRFGTDFPRPICWQARGVLGAGFRPRLAGPKTDFWWGCEWGCDRTFGGSEGPNFWGLIDGLELVLERLGARTFQMLASPRPRAADPPVLGLDRPNRVTSRIRVGVISAPAFSWAAMSGDCHSQSSRRSGPPAFLVGIAILLAAVGRGCGQGDKPPDYSGKSLTQWIDILKNAPNGERWGAADEAQDALGPRGPYAKTAIPALIDALDTDDISTRWQVADTSY
jgi:hypothetical protein